MVTDHLRSILLILSELSPSTWNLAKSIYEGRSELTFESSDSPPTWCTCGKCSVMLNERENVCCNNKTKNHEDPEFHQLVLDEKVLDLAMKGNADWLCYNFNTNAVHTVALELSWKGQRKGQTILRCAKSKKKIP